MSYTRLTSALDVLESVARGVATIPALAEDTGRRPGSVSELLHRLRERGLVRRRTGGKKFWVGGERGTRPQRWDVTPAGLLVLAAGRP